jgi:glycosyltransferase involved in cell wall biosynthesis
VKVNVVIPALNEARAIGRVVRAVPVGSVDRVIVVDNGSTDATAEEALAAGASVVEEPIRGYGAACLAGARAAAEADIIVFMDGDYSDDPAELPSLLSPLARDEADLVVAHRKLEKGSMPWHARFGNRLIVHLLRGLHHVPLEDLGSFRAIKKEVLFALKMKQMTFGWPVEMVVKAARKGYRMRSVPVRYRRRLGTSKVSGSLRGSILAAYYMLTVPLRELLGG